MQEQVDLAGRVALVTGGGRGIGRAHALLLAKLGAAVVVNDLGSGVQPGSAASAEPAKSVAEEIESAGGLAVASLADIARPDGAREAVDLALQAFGRIDCLVNNAGTSVHVPFEQVTPEELESMLRLHIGGHFFVTQAAWPHMLRQRHGRIVMTTSGSGLFGSSGNHHYAAAKGGVAGLTRSLALDAAAHGITVNAIAPIAATRLADNIADENLRRTFQATFRPEQVAPVVAWLVSDRCSVNGEIFEVGGGLVARIMMAEGRGWLDPAHGPGDVELHLSEILAEAGYALPRCGEETIAKLLPRLAVATSGTAKN